MAAKIKHIIFDLGGVILDIDEKMAVHELQKRNVDLSLVESEAFQSIDSRFERGILTAASFRRRVKDLFGLPKLSDADFDYIWNAILLDIPRERIQALEEIKEHYQIFLMSNTNEIHYDLYVRDLQLRFGYKQFDDLFDKSYFSFDVHLLKPDPLFFELILEHQGLKPEETLFIDDTPANIEVARQMGIHTYHIHRDELVRNLFQDGILRKDVELDIYR
ncbi:MAG: HAD family phosphatase [Bacteroidales bacterium]|nr:HAD family phosphatase [Bacteroidales bacterium]